ncbi:glycosyl transferase [Candidatus Symbiopectobacterium sp. 'North America']|uniref:glycosyltransferase family 2 protein n=1 Tax=Candidatus Symbiopectobacterium sp. 'North America' TaxID=2794574 RepID=UPI0018CA72F0|nr:glycosyltransferase family 2 protein [Candidatus Symbiopectobacterium sp. 'North America']MBG6244348.1 glycosyl transferase [Candidatus Symbiopectobacterium sp. 'North America']
MRISIITATYNSEKTIKDTLLSIERQSHNDIEYIIIDGGSTDRTIHLINRLSTRVSKIISEPDKGIYDALNKGINAATGEVVGFLHSDDFFAYDDVLKNIVEEFESKNCDAIYGDLEYVSQYNVEKCLRVWKSGIFSRHKLMLGWMPPHPSFYMKRSCYIKYGCFSLDYNIAADYNSILRYLFKNEVVLSYMPRVLIKMRVGGLSNRSVRTMAKKSLEDIRIMKNNGIPWPLAIVCKNLSKIPQFFRRNYHAKN